MAWETRRRWWVAVAAWVCFSLGLPQEAAGEIIMDPKPPMRWEELVGCELVVVAKYQGHEGKNTLHLHVIRVLKGDAAKPGGQLAVSLEHWYSVETGPVGHDTWWPEKAKGDQTPKLCFKQQLMNPGPAVPCRAVPDVREPAVYFFPKAARPTLERRGQVCADCLTDGWEQAVNGKPTALAFRLMQTASPELAESAVEELGRTRDPAVLARLVDWTLQPPGASEPHGWGPYAIAEADAILARVGDRDGDVYAPLFKWYTEGGRPAGQYAQHRVGCLLPRLDPERAFRDFSKLLREGNAQQRRSALVPLSGVGSEAAIALCVAALESEELAETAHGCLDRMWSSYGSSDRECARREAFAIPLLVKAIASPKVATRIRAELRNLLSHLHREPRELDLARAEGLLLNPADQCYHGMAEGEAHKLLEAMADRPDPRFAPLLARVLREVPPAREHQGYSYHRAFTTHAKLFPNVMRKELERCGVERGLIKRDYNTDYQLRAHLWGLVGPQGDAESISELVDVWGPAWIRKHGLPQDAAAALVERLQDRIRERSGPSCRELEWLFLADPKSARETLDAALAARRNFTDLYNRSGCLAIAVREGHRELVNELISTVNDAIAEQRRRNDSGARNAIPLLTSKHPRALAAYLDLLDGSRRLCRSRFANGAFLDSDYTYMLRELRNAAPKEYFARILSLAASERIPERHEAEQELSWLEYRAADLAPQREKKLEGIRPILQQLGEMSATERHRFVLGRYGFALEGKPGPAWLPALVRAVGHWDQHVAASAVALLGEVADPCGAEGLLRFRPPERERLARLWAADRGFPVPPAVGE